MPQPSAMEQLRQLKEQAITEINARGDSATKITIGMGTCGIAAGAREVMHALLHELEALNLDATVVATGCVGLCSQEPLVDIEQPGGLRVTYGKVNPQMVPTLISEHLVKGHVLTQWAVARGSTTPAPVRPQPESVRSIPTYDDIPFYGMQVRIALRNCGVINPEEIQDYIVRGGYEALGRAIFEMSPEEIINTVKQAGLRGRGGAGFPTGLKWELTRKAPGDVKYIICNADEGDPGAFMDRSILEGDPHTVVEGMLIAARAIGATEGYVYCRAEYPLAIKRLQKAIEEARERALLGEKILGSDFSFDLHIKQGAGAFVCGEETALIASIEGRRGEPRPRPPFPAVSGLWGKPTSINNVETWANVPPIISHGAEWFSSIGTEKSKGTKVFALTGKVNKPGLVEVPMGITMQEIIYDIGGGIPNDKKFKAVQTGGPLGGCLPTSMLATPVDYDSLTSAGATMGSGGMIVIDEDTCMVEFAKFFLTFATDESCGQCTPCRVGGKRMLEVLTRITDGKGTMNDLKEIDQLAKTMADTSLCALGQLTPNPTLSSLRHFKEEFLAHIVDKKCPAGVCTALLHFDIVADKCKGCSLCLISCPTGAIEGARKQVHSINQDKCIKCGSCYDVCRLDAVIKS